MTADTQGIVFQFTDCHVFDPASKALHQGVDANASLLACLEGARQFGAPDLIIFSGDLSHDESIASYQFLAKSVVEYFADITCLIQMGNHDNLLSMQQVFPYHNCQMQKHFRFDDWAVYLIETESHYADLDKVQVCPDTYRDLEELATDSDIENILVFMHYNLVELEFRGIKCEVTETDHLRQALSETGKVRSVSSGHIHQEYHWLDRGIIYTSTPTTGFQSHLANGQESNEQIGFKRFELFSDNSISMDTIRICPPIK